MQILIENTTTKFKKYFDDVEIKNGKIYLETQIDNSNLNDGEYRLFLYNDSNELISSDLLKIGEYNIENKRLKVFKQYGK